MPSTPTTVYVFVDDGEKATLFETLLFQLNEVPASTVADNETDSPEHMAWSAPAFTVGNVCEQLQGVQHREGGLALAGFVPLLLRQIVFICAAYYLGNLLSCQFTLLAKNTRTIKQ